MPKLTSKQRKYIRKKSKVPELGPDETDDELNIIPFLDVVVNIIMFLLMSMAAVAYFSQVEASLPSLGRGSGGAPPEPSLNLNVTVAQNGIIVAGSGGKLAPGCTETASGRVMTVPKIGSDYNWEALTACVAQVKREFPDETKVTISGDPLVTYQDIISAMDAVRNKDSDVLFPDVLLSAGVR